MDFKYFFKELYTLYSIFKKGFKFVHFESPLWNTTKQKILCTKTKILFVGALYISQKLIIRRGVIRGAKSPGSPCLLKSNSEAVIKQAPPAQPPPEHTGSDSIILPMSRNRKDSERGLK